MVIQTQTFVDLGATQHEAQQMLKVLKPKETADTMNSLQFVQLAKDFQKLKGIDLLDYDNVDYKKFSAFASDVEKGVEKINDDKIKGFILYFASMTVDAVRNACRKIFDVARKIYSTVAKNVTKFFTYLSSTKVSSATLAMHQLKKATVEWGSIDKRIQTLYDECYWSYKENVLRHLLRDRILDIESYHIDHILAQLSDLGNIVQEAIHKYEEAYKDMRHKKDNLIQQKKDTVKKYDDKISNKTKWRNRGGCAALIGVAGFFLGISFPLVIAVAAGGLITGAYNEHKRGSLKTEKKKEVQKVEEQLEKQEELIAYWKEQRILGRLRHLSRNIKEFHEHMLNIKQQYDTKKNLQECEGDIALWLAKKNKHDNDNEKLKIYRDFLEELGVENYNTFINIEENDIKEVFDKLKKIYKTGILRQIRNVIKKFCSDKELTTKVDIKVFKNAKN